jgi:hypothetical protein
MSLHEGQLVINEFENLPTGEIENRELNAASGSMTVKSAAEMSVSPGLLELCRRMRADVVAHWPHLATVGDEERKK